MEVRLGYSQGARGGWPSARDDVFLLLNLLILSNTLRPAGRKTRTRKYKALGDK